MSIAAVDIAITQLMVDEGCRLTAYPDPLSGAEPWTVGFGSTGPDVSTGTVWTQAQADMALASRVTSLDAQLQQRLPCYPTLDDLRQAVLLNMAYNLGLNGLLAFRQTLAYVAAGEYAQAGAAMLQSNWAKQVPARANRLSVQMTTGASA